MKTYKYLYSLLAAVALLFTAACSPDDYEMGAQDISKADLVEGKAFSITHDESNPNIVYLKTLLPDNYQVSWIEPQGRTQDRDVELHMPFPGTYNVLFGVDTRGGVVFGDTAHFTIDNFYAEFVNNELYNNLAGGVGNSKTWVPDNGQYGLASGEVSFGDPSIALGWNNFTPNWEPAPGDGGEANSKTSPFFKSTMTFNLINGANVQIHTVSNDGAETDESGTYQLDLDNYRLNLTDAKLLHEPGWEDREDAAGWAQNIRIVTLTDNQLRLAVLRNPNTSGEGEWWLVFNFVSKEYADNYHPSVNYKPILEDGWRDFVEPKTDKIVTYKLTGFDWYNNDETTSARNVSGVDPIDNLEDIQITLNSGDNTYSFTGPDGTSTSGSYTLDNDGIYTFTPALPTIALSKDGRAVLTTNSGQLRILSFSQAANCSSRTGALENITWGSREYDDQGNFYQYMGYKWSVVRAGVKKTYKAGLHFFDTGWTTQQSDDVYVVDGTDADYTFTINGSSAAPYGMYLDIEKILQDHPNCDVAIKDIKVDGQSIAFDDAVIDRVVGDAATTARRYILNPWGPTASDASKYVFNSSIAVTVSVKMDNGTPFVPASAKRHYAKRARR